MSRVGIIGLLIALAAAAPGCQKQLAPSPSPPSSAPPTQAGAPAPPAKAKEDQPPAEAKKEAAVAPPAKKPAAAVVVQPPPKPERIVLLTPGGPLLVDVLMTIDGRPQGAALREQIDAALAAATDEKGARTWSALLANADYLRGALYRGEELSASERRSITNQYDENDDGQVQRAEAAAWLAGDAGRGEEAFSVRSSRAYVPSARTHSRVWPFLDRDNDGELSAAELEAAGDILLKLDADDDQTLTVDELATLREQLLANNQAELRDATRDAAYRLQPGYVIERLDYLLPDLYSPLQPLSAKSFRDLPRLFAQLDKWDDGQLDRDDLQQLLTTPAHLELTVAFNSPTGRRRWKPSDWLPLPSELAAVSLADAIAVAAGDFLGAVQAAMKLDRPATVTVKSMAAELRELGLSEPDRIPLALGGTRLVLQAYDADGAPQMMAINMPAVGANRNRVALMVHDQEDPLFEELDADGDGRLGTREMASCGATLLRRDANQDGVLKADELPYTMIIAFVRGEQANTRNFYIPPRSPRTAPSEAVPLWFRHADLNNDGDISRREFVGSPERFEELDANGDGFIGPQEAPE